MSTVTQSPTTVQTPTGIPTQTWIAAVHAETVRLKTEKRTLGRRLDDAEDLALGGAVTLDSNGLWQVESRTSPGVTWQVSGSCDCPDAEKGAPEGLCAHRLAVGITKRALKAVQILDVTKEKYCAPGNTPDEHATGAQPLQPGHEKRVPLPEAAFSLCLKGRWAGQDAQLTIRGATYDEFARNVAAVRGLLDAPGQVPAPTTPSSQAPQPETPPPCPTHGPMKASTKAPGTWYCTKKLYDGSYCKSRWPEA